MRDDERRFELSPGEEEEEKEEEEGARNSAGMVLEVHLITGKIIKNPAVKVYVALFWCCSCCCLCRTTIPLEV